MSFAGTKRPRSPDSDEELSEGEVQDLSSSSSSSSEAISQPPRKIKASQTHKMSPGSFSKNLDYQAIEKKKAKKLAKLRKKRRKRRKAAKRRLQLREENGDKRKRKATDSFPLSSSKEPQSSTSYSSSVPPRSAPSNIPTSVIVHTKLSYEPELVSPFGSPAPPSIPPPPPPPPPPPEDDSQPSQPASVLPGKEDLVQSMELVDREITEVEQQISQLEKRLMQEEMELLAEEKANADMPPGSSSHGGDKEGKDSSHKDDDSTNKKEGENLSVVDELTSYYSETMQSLIRKIYAENRKRAAAAHALCSVKDSAPVYSSAPLYNQPSDLPFYKENQEKAKAFHPKLVAYLRRKRDQKLAWKQRTAREYNRLHREWTKRVERWENDPRRKAKESKIRDFYERMFPEIKRQREQQERFQRAQRPLDGFARSDADLKEIIDGLRDQELLEKQVYSLSVEPPDLLDSDERKVQFISRNGLVEDPMADHKQRRMNALWTDDEKRIFREQFVKHPKDFERIALHLPKKSCGDCVQYYYLSKKKEGYKQMLRKYSQAKRRTKVVQSRPQLAAGMEDKTKEIAERREHGVFGIEQDSGRITYTVPNWKEEEIEAMKEGLREWGKDWPTISNRIGTKTEHQCRSFFTHYKRKLHLVSYLNEYKAREKAVGMRYATAEEDEKEKKTDDAATLSRPSSLQDILLLSRENISLPSAETSNLADSAARTALTPTPEQEQFKKFINLAASVVHDYESSRQSTGDALAEEQPKEESLQLTPPPPPPPSSVRVHFSGILTEPSSSSSSSSVLTAVVSTAPELVTATVTAASSPSIANKPILVASPPPPPPSIFKPSVEQVLQLSFASSASHSAAPVLPPLIPLAVSANSAPVEPPETPTVVKLALQGVPFEADPTVSADNESSHRRESEIDVKEDGVEELKLSKDDNVIQKDDDEVTSEKITESDGDDGGRRSDESVADSEESHEEGEIISDEEEIERDEDAEKSVHDDEKGSESDVVVVLSTSSETRKPFVDEPAEQATAGSDGDKEELWSSQEDCGSLYQEEETAHCGGMTPEEEKKDDERATRTEAAREERAKERSEVLTSSQENSETSSIRHAEDESAFQYEAISPPDSMTSSIGDGGDDRSTLPVSSPFLSTTPTESGTLSPSYSSPYLAATKEKRYVPLLEAISSEEED